MIPGPYLLCLTSPLVRLYGFNSKPCNHLVTFRHLLIAFGGLAGLEESIEEDGKLKVCSFQSNCPIF